MGVPAQPGMRPRRFTPPSGPAPLGRRGVALPVSLLAVVAITLLAAGAWLVVDLNARSMENREATARALQMAEAGAAHAASLLEAYTTDRTLTRLLVGEDSLPGTEDDGLLTGYGIPDEMAIGGGGFAWNGGVYNVRIVDDPSEGDGDLMRDRNDRVLVRCSGRVGGGARATIDFVYGSDPLPPSIVVDGEVTLGGSVELRGSCGGVYGNALVDVSGTLVVEQSVISSDTVHVSGSIEDPFGNDVPPLVHQPSIRVPTYDVWDTCAGADYVLRADGWVTEVATGLSYNGTTGQGAFGWKRQKANPVVWDLNASHAVEGTFCAKGNARLNGNLGTEADPFRLSVFATGGITMSGNVHIQSENDAGLLLMAKGDLEVGGNASGGGQTPGSETYGGLLFAGSQCAVHGNTVLSGQLFCGDDPDPPGAEDYAEGNAIDGNVEVRYTCPPPSATPRRTIAWFQRFEM